jgi:hypothetical protein
MCVNFTAILSILLPFRTFHGHLVYVVVILVYLSRFGMLCKEKSGSPEFELSTIQTVSPAILINSQQVHPRCGLLAQKMLEEFSEEESKKPYLEVRIASRTARWHIHLNTKSPNLGIFRGPIF